MQIMIRRVFVPESDRVVSAPPPASAATTPATASSPADVSIPPPLVLYRPAPNQVRVYRYRDDASAINAVANIPLVADWGFDAAAITEWNAQKPVAWYEHTHARTQAPPPPPPLPPPSLSPFLPWLRGTPPPTVSSEPRAWAGFTPDREQIDGKTSTGLVLFRAPFLSSRSGRSMCASLSLSLFPPLSLCLCGGQVWSTFRSTVCGEPGEILQRVARGCLSALHEGRGVPRVVQCRPRMHWVNAHFCARAHRVARSVPGHRHPHLAARV